MADSTYAAGWYPDASAPDAERYYDGTAWTEQTRPLAGAAIATDVAAVPVNEKPVKRPWYKRKAIIIAAAIIVGLIVLVNIISAINGVASDIVDATDDKAITQVDEKPAAEDEEPVAEEPEVAKPQELVLGEQAFGIDSDGYGWYAVEVTNPNTDYVFTSLASITVEAYDAAGVLLDTGSTYGTILQGSSMYVGDFYDIGSGVIDHIEVRGPEASDATHSPQTETGTFTMGAITTGSEYDRMNVNGTVTSNFVEDQEMVRIDLVARNAAGQIIGVDYTFTDRVPAGGTAAWNVSFWQVPLDSQITAFAHL